jgi:hypothetical protein
VTPRDPRFEVVQVEAPAAPVWTGVIYAVVGVVCVVLIVLGVDRGSDTLLLVGALGLLGVCLLAPLVAAVRVSVHSGEAGRLAEVTQALERLAEEQALSDDARRVLNRRRERDILCRAIEEDIARRTGTRRRSSSRSWLSGSGTAPRPRSSGTAST